MFTEGKISDVVVRELTTHVDSRGWLTELFRQDELDPPFHPVMSYVSMTKPGVVRGPHEHRSQADFFVFLGPSVFTIHLWDYRRSSPTYMTKEVLIAGEGAPKSVLIPPGVVHAYKNTGTSLGMVVNLPNRLFAGQGRREPVDEIRHELDPDTKFVVD